MHDIYEVGALQEQVKYREVRILELERQIAALRDQCAMLESEVCVQALFLNQLLILIY